MATVNLTIMLDGTAGTTTQNLNAGDVLVLTVNTVTPAASIWYAFAGTGCTVSPQSPASGTRGGTATVTLNSGATSYSVSFESDYPVGEDSIFIGRTVSGTITATTPTYSVANASTNEGASATVNVTTTNVANGTTLYWTVDASTADVSTTSGSFTVNSNAGSFTIPAIADSLTEGNEAYTISVRAGSTAGTVVASSTLTINDTSTTPTPTYSVANASTNEGASATVNVTTTNVANGTTLYWTVGATTADVSTTSGSFTISANAGSFTIPAIADSLTEGSEAYTISVRTGSTAGTVVASSILTINDTSTTPAATYSVANASTNEGASATVNVTTANVANGTTLYWTVDASTLDVSTTSGSFTINSNAGSFTIPAIADSLTEGTEFYTISVKTGSTAGTTVASSILTINDTSTTPAPTYSVANASTNEGANATVNVTTTNVPNGTTLYWTVGATTADVSATSGSFTINSNVGSFTIFAIADSLTEGSEAYTISIKTGSTAGTTVASSTLTINDTSTTPSPTFFIYPSATSVNEGGTIQWQIDTTNFVSGTLYYTNNGTTNASDFVDNLNSGSITITDNSGTLSKVLSSDVTTEGSETIVIRLHTGSTSGPVVAVSDSVTVNDTSTFDITPNDFSFTDQGAVALNSTITSAPVTISGINTGIPISVSNGSYSIDSTTNFVNTSGTVSNNQVVRVRHNSPNASSTSTATTLTVGTIGQGGIQRTFTSTTFDVIPNDFGFTSQGAVPLNSTITSAAVTINGINTSIPVSVSNGTYSVDGVNYFTSGSVSNGQSITVRHTSPNASSTSTTTTLTVGVVGVGALQRTFTSTTFDVAPDDFNFTNQGAVALNSTITSAAVTINGINTSIPVSVSNGTYSVDGVNYFTSGSVTNGQSITVRHTSPNASGTSTSTTLTVGTVGIGGLQKTFTSTTFDVIPDDFNFINQNPVPLNSTITSASVTISGINTAVPISVSNGTYSLDGVNYLTSGTVTNGQSVTVRHTSPNAPSTSTATTLTVGVSGVGALQRTFTSTTGGATYSASSVSVNEGSSVTVNVSTANVPNNTTLYWTVDAGADVSSTSGSFTINANAGSFTIAAIADSLTEGSEAYTISIRTGSTTGTVVASSTLTINDTSLTPAYSVGNASTNEGASATVNVTTANVANGTTLYWTVDASTADVSATSGSFTISANAGSFTISAIADSLTEGSEAYTISIRTGSTTGTVVASSTLTINDTSLTPGYSVANASTNEGNSATVNVTTANVANGTTLYWTVNATTADVSTTSGSFTINANAGSFTIATVADSLTEGSETYTISIRIGSTAGTVVASSTLTINDTSTTPPTYSVGSVSVNEGASATVNVTTTNVANGTTLYWTVNAGADVFITSGSFTISANAGSFTIPTVADSTTEGTEVYTISVRTISTAGTVVASSTLTINDTSTTPGGPPPPGATVYGFEAWNLAGEKTISITTRIAKFFGTASIGNSYTGTAVSGTITDSRFTQYSGHTPFAMPIFGGIDLDGNTVVLSFSGNTLTWSFPNGTLSPGTSTRPDTIITYGIF
jgi:hypothetical protein